MKGTPSVKVYKFQGKDNIYSFVRGDDDRLHVCYWDAQAVSWKWADLGQPANALVDSSPSALTSLDAVARLHAFVRGNDGHLHQRSWDGSRWLDWVDHGQPNNSSINASPSALAFRTIGGPIDLLHIFSWGADTSGEYLFRFSHHARAFNFHGLTATGASVTTEPGVAATFGTSASMCAFVVGNDSRLSVSFNLGTLEGPFQWLDLGTPAGRTLNWLRPAVIFIPGGGLRSFSSDSTGDLWANVWNGNDTQGSWVALGRPPGTSVGSPASVVSFRFGGTDFMYVFLRGANDNLYICRWDGAGDVLWADVGRPQTQAGDVPATPQAGNTPVLSPPDAVTYRFIAGTETSDRMYAFVLGGDNHMHVCYWNGVDWRWTDLGSPSIP